MEWVDGMIDDFEFTLDDCIEFCQNVLGGVKYALESRIRGFEDDKKAAK